MGKQSVEDYLLYEGKKKYATCDKCKSVWPTSTTTEAYKNYLRATLTHPGEKCTNFQEDVVNKDHDEKG